ncbi:hypothetical protein [Clostridium sp. Cult3]|uniref:hypothetical protein n=1 Tax=Clostridium sp. Cult3 TaxID=2079004 RepID=UPI001F25288D|nr:hypothetical protein [Clostridium sp. Cult3]MCF6459799.1 hypothetical protein [Clostridium sp. Cult3]
MGSGIVLLLLYLLASTKINDILGSSPSSGKRVSNLSEDRVINLNIPYTKEKIKIMKKIGPFFPEELILPLNKSLFITEKVIRLYETTEFIKASDISYIDTPVPVENNMERLSYIVNTIQKEFPKEDVQNVGNILNIIINIDKYKAIFNSLQTLISNPDSLNNPSKLFDLVEPLMEGKDEEEKKKIKDMAKLLGVMNKLEGSKIVEKKDD